MGRCRTAQVHLRSQRTVHTRKFGGCHSCLPLALHHVTSPKNPPWSTVKTQGKWTTNSNLEPKFTHKSVSCRTEQKVVGWPHPRSAGKVPEVQLLQHVFRTTSPDFRGKIFDGQHLCYAPNSFGMIVGNLIFGELYSTLWPSTTLRCYNLMSLGLQTQGRDDPLRGICCPGFQHCVHKP